MSSGPRAAGLPAAVAALFITGALAGTWALGCAPARASTPDDPVRLAVSAPAVVSLDAFTPISVSVQSDPGAFDIAEAPVRLRVRLSGAECRDTFATTSGPVAIDERLPLPARPSPALAITLTGRARPGDFGTSTVCAFVEEEGSDRLFASDSNTQVTVSRACTDATRRQAGVSLALSGARHELETARGALRRAHRSRTRARARRRLRRATGRVTNLTRALGSATGAVGTACA